MDFEWDERKREEIRAQRGFDLLVAARIFLGEVVSWRDERADYGEEREVSTGMVGEDCFVVVHTKRGDFIRLITAWKGGRRAKSEYQKGISSGDRGDGS